MAADNDFDAKYQQGQRSVEHRNLDASGDDHPFGNEPQEFTADMRSLIRRVADDLYSSWEATIREYLANAETACLKVAEYRDDPEASMYDEMYVPDSYQPRIEVTWNKQEDTVTMKDNGIGMAAAEVDQIFRQIGRSSSRDDGGKSGNFGQGALSFVKLTGLDNAMIMTSHSRLNDDNAAYYVTLAGVEPIRGSLPGEAYGTEFQMTPNGDYDIRSAVSKYAEWMRVPVRYEEIGGDGAIDFQEDYGDKKLYEQYDDSSPCFGLRVDGAFEAYCSPDAHGETLLLSMPIDRNDGTNAKQHNAPFPFDVRLLSEAGTVIESSNGNEGLMPAVPSDYEQMLLDEREQYITDDLCNNNDVIGQTVTAGPNEGAVVVSPEVLDSGRPIPSGNEYLTPSEVSDADEPGARHVIFGPNKGREVIPESEWNDLPEGRAAHYVPENELDEYDVESGEGDLQLPQPTSDRDRLQQHAVFWEYVANEFAQEFADSIDDIYETLSQSDDVLETFMDLEPEELVISPADFD